MESQYTDLQARAILAFENNFNYDTLEDNLGDNCTPVDDSEIAEWLGIGKKEAQGVLVSLGNAGIVEASELFEGFTRTGRQIVRRLYMVTGRGIEEHYRLKAEATEAQG